MENKKETKVGLILLVISVLVLGLGITFAAFTLTSRGNTINQINTGTVTMTYENANNGISISNALPITDEEGKKLINTDQYFDFVVSINITGSQNISYEVTAEKIIDASSELETLNNNEVRLYLQRGDNSTTYSDEILEPSYFTPLNKEDSFGAGTSEMVLDSGTVNSTTKYYYRLRMWVDKDYQTTDQVKYFTVKVNVYGRDGSMTSNPTENLLTMEKMCPGCKFVYANDTLTVGESTMPVDSTNDYTTLTSNHPYFLGLIANEETGVIERAFACGKEDKTTFCIEGNVNTKWLTNVNILNTIYPSCGADASKQDKNCAGTVITYVHSGGDACVSDSNTGCCVFDYGEADCDL